MPLFDYHCEDCGCESEHLVRREDEPIECPQCQGRRMTRLVSAPARPVSSGGSLPLSGGCGKPQCGLGGCGMG